MPKATFSQHRYIKNLIAECNKRRVEVPNELLESVENSDLNVAQASEIIDTLRFELGYKDHDEKN